MNNRQIYRRSIAPHNSRVMGDGGEASDRINAAIELMRFYEEQKDNIKLFYFPALTGNKIRTSGLNKFVSKGYSLNSPQQESMANDAVQTTSTSQPYLSGNIAPNEIACIKNPNGGSNYMTHPTISFANNIAWTMSIIINDMRGNANFAGDGVINNSNNIGFSTVSIRLDNSNAASSFSNPLGYKHIGKINKIDLVATNSGIIKFYFNGLPLGQQFTNTSIAFGSLLKGFLSNQYNSNSIIYGYILRDMELSQQQITQEYSLIRNFIPEVESVVIGTQTWATSNCEMAATPMGNVITEMQAAANVEKITNAADREFSSDTGFWIKGSEWSIGGGFATKANAIASTLNANVGQQAGKWYKVVVVVSTLTAGSFQVVLGGTSAPTLITTTGTFTYYIQASSIAYLYLTNNTTFIGSIDSISVQEVGWSDSQNLYDWIYAQTTGTTEQKTYAGVKAAAMWAHYNNDVALGAIYGKLYNWFAVKLLQMDIDYYNTVNPTTPWGWRVPTNTDLSTLQTALGGAAVSGKKLKVIGAIYWSSNNGNNTSGFSAIGSGQRSSTNGVYGLLGLYCNLLSSIETGSNTNYYMYIRSSGDETAIGSNMEKTSGNSLRLIKT